MTEETPAAEALYEYRERLLLAIYAMRIHATCTADKHYNAGIERALGAASNTPVEAQPDDDAQASLL